MAGVGTFEQDLQDSKKVERRVGALYEARGYHVAAAAHKFFPYDLHIVETSKRKAQAWRSVEVKSFACRGAAPYAFFETESLSTGVPPEYIRNVDRIDYMIRINTETNIAYEIDNEQLVHVLSTASYRFTNNCFNTARGVVLNVTDRDIGFLRVL